METKKALRVNMQNYSTVQAPRLMKETMKEGEERGGNSCVKSTVIILLCSPLFFPSHSLLSAMPRERVVERKCVVPEIIKKILQYSVLNYSKV